MGPLDQFQAGSNGWDFHPYTPTPPRPQTTGFIQPEKPSRHGTSSKQVHISDGPTSGQVGHQRLVQRDIPQPGRPVPRATCRTIPWAPAQAHWVSAPRMDKPRTTAALTSVFGPSHLTPTSCTYPASHLAYLVSSLHGKTAIYHIKHWGRGYLLGPGQIEHQGSRPILC